MAGEPNAQIAADIQSKFEFYFIGLIFTLLGFAIQTAKPSQIQSVAICEIMSWLTLLAAGLIANKKTNKLISGLFKVQFSLFICSLLLLIYSRGYENISLIYKNWLHAQHTEIKLCFSTFETCLRQLKL